MAIPPYETGRHHGETENTGLPRTGSNIFLITALGASTVALVTVMIGFILFVKHRFALETGKSNTLLISGLVANQADRTLSGIEQLLLSIDSSLDLTGCADRPHAPEVRRLLMKHREHNPFLMDILILNPGGTIIHWTGNGTPPEVGDRDYGTAHTGGNHPGMFVGAPKISRVHDNRWFFGASIGIRNPSGELARVVVGIVDLEPFHLMFTGLSYPNEATLILAHGDGTLVTRNPSHHAVVGRKVKEIKAFWDTGRKTGSGRGVSPLDGMERMVSFTRVSDYPLLAGGSFSMNTILKEWHEDLVGYSLMGGLLVLSMGGMLWFTVKRQQALVENQRKLFKMAATDPLTGLYNRRYFMPLAEKEFERAARYGDPFSILMMDIDHFKEVNDRFGHRTGDRVLISLSAVITSVCRASDLLCRYGGEEFVALLPATNLDGAVSTGEKIRARIGAEAFDTGEEPLGLTISVGVASFRKNDVSMDRLLNRADEALYKAKEQGRNRVCSQGRRRDET